MVTRSVPSEGSLDLAEQARGGRLEGELPILVVGRLSTGEASRARALEDRFGVPAYWVLDPASQVLQALKPSGWCAGGSGRGGLGRPLVAVGEAARGATFATGWPWQVSPHPEDLA